MSSPSDEQEQVGSESKASQLKESNQDLMPLDAREYPLMFFDLSIRGHHPAYIQHLIQYFVVESLPGRLVIVVSPHFLTEHKDVIEFARHSTTQVQFQAISQAETKMLGQRKTPRQRLLRTFREWQLLVKYARALEASHCLALYLDTCLRPLAISQSLPCPLSGIYFRPTFHYSTFSQPHASNLLQRWQELGLLSLVGLRSQVHTFFSLDPFAVPELNRRLRSAQAIHLPDPVLLETASTEQVDTLREKLGIKEDRRIALLFGALTQRKGVPQLLDAVAQLSSNEAQKLCLLLVGESNIADQLNHRIAQITKQLPIQILSHYEFVPEADVSAYFQLADLVLAPYQRHVGMSGILLQAAAASKPVLSSDYGLMGELVHRHQLGVTVDSTQPTAIAQGLKEAMAQPLESLGNLAQMQAFAKQNSATRFAQVIFETLLSTPRSS